ncbi:MAG: DUF4835 family protein [Flavobacteriales bacterium]|nr:DUF4835 family protein [Flavobacteriales bacterium]
MFKSFLSFTCTLLLVLTQSFSFAQELNCTVQVSDQQIQSDKTIFELMQKAIRELMNNTKWTDDVFSEEEKIDCSILINITEKLSANDFKGTIQVQSSRPVFGTGYSTNLISVKDNNFQIQFNQFDQLLYSENAYTTELVAILSFYAYMIIGMDYDSFSLKGGTPYFEKALSIVNISANSGRSGWKSFESKENRYWYVNNQLDQFFEPLRECFYEYHIKGFDIMGEKLNEARTQITTALRKIETIHNTRPNWYNTKLFFYAKTDEIVNLYKSAPQPEKASIVALLKKVNPANSSKYNRILTAK